MTDKFSNMLVRKMKASTILNMRSLHIMNLFQIIM